MRFDVLFYDMACNKSYTFDSLENDSLGGTEATTIRLAEGFASKGLKVGIIQKFDSLPTTSPAGVSYLPPRWATVVKPKNVIHLRGRAHLEKFKSSNQVIWLHDAAGLEHNNCSDWGSFIGETCCVAVSDWHVNNIRSIAPTLNVSRIYSPIDNSCYSHPRPEVDKNQLVWMSSPHKGLPEALDKFHELWKQNHQLKLVVFNPGYFDGERKVYPGVRYVPKAKRADMLLVVASSLALFYPTKFEETFGLIAAEANALGVPIICDPVAGLAESSSTFFKPEDIPQLQTNRPIVNGQERFRFDNIWPEWEKILQ